MSDWPQKTWLSKYGIPCEERPYGVRQVEVIPADLGRELYEALAQIKRLIAASESSPDIPLPKSTLFQIGLETEAALARYEREVGK